MVAHTTGMHLIEWPSHSGSRCIEAICPNCGDGQIKQLILRMAWPHSNVGLDNVALLSCSGCGCGFIHPAEAADYATEPAGGESALAFYLQQGAGIQGIAENITDLQRPAATTLLEVGCGFGFGLDFARRALGWTVLGFDPSPFAIVGRDLLCLPIESRYLLARDQALNDHQFDVIMASEVLEHVASPPDFVRTLKVALRNDGILLITTPDVDAVNPATPPGILTPLLSAGYHLVLQSAESLTKLLQDAGFANVDVSQVGGAQLRARCNGGPAIDSLTVGRAPIQDSTGAYRRYLMKTAGESEPGSDLWFGLTARAYREAVSAADRDNADRLWPMFAFSCRLRFGFDPDNQPSTARMGDSLDGLVTGEPFCLGPVLLHRAYHRLLEGQSRSAVEILFDRAAEACARLRRALQQIGSDDGDAENVGWVASSEAALCAAERGATGVPERYQAIGNAPSDRSALRDGRPAQTDHYRRRLYVSLINAGALADADRLSDVVGDVEKRSRVPSVILADDELDTLFCAAVRELQRRTNGAARALELLERLTAACNAAKASGRAKAATRLLRLGHERTIVALKVLGRTREARSIQQNMQSL